MKYFYPHCTANRSFSIFFFLLIFLAPLPPEAHAQSQAAKDAYNLALACNKLDFDCKINNHTKAIQLDPNYVLAYYNRGNAYSKKGNYDLAIADFSKAIQLDPNYEYAYCNRGLAYIYKGNYDLAIADYNKAIQLDPNSTTAYNGRGSAYKNKRNYDLAIADYNKAIQLDSNYAIGYNNRGNVYSDKGNYDLAIADYNKAIQLDPNYIDAYINRGLVYSAKGNYDLAISEYNKAIQLDSNYALAYFNHAWANLYLNNGDKAYQDAALYLKQNGLKGDFAPYAIIVGYLGLRKSSATPAAKIFLESWLKQVGPDAWTTQILKYFNGQLTADQLLALATDNDKLTEAHAYIAEVQLLENKNTEALVHFKWVRDNGNKTFTEYTLSIAELKRLN